ncbi:MAG: PHP domain-containing protein, partial [Alphaproteobacteria bacterium]
MRGRDIPKYPAGADLHLHTVYSDGTLTPQEVVQAALELKFRAIALTDHDATDGVEPARTAAVGKPLQIIAGCEFATCIEECKELHVVGIFLDADTSGRLSEALALYGRRRLERIKKTLGKLLGLGIRLDLEKLLSSSAPGTVGRLHIARKLVSMGLAS